MKTQSMRLKKCVLWVGPMAIDASLHWEKTDLAPLGLLIAHVPKGLEAH